VPERPSIAELRAVTQPPSVTGRRSAEHWTGDLYQRRLSPYLTRVLLGTAITANGVTVLMIVTGAAAGAALLVPGLLGAVLAALLGQLQMLWDCCDGEVARWRQTSSPKGVYLDRVGHYVAECGISVALGIRAARELELGNVWVSLGLLLGLLVCLNKVENDLVHVSRHYAGLPQMQDTESVRKPAQGALRRARQIARFVPFHRVFHSVELSLLILVAALLDLWLDGVATQWLLIGLCVAAAITLVGHLAAVLSSPRLR